jgi:SMI1 / KNR4 family (SUKH-1)
LNLDTFWQQPAAGFNEASRGRTESELDHYQQAIGFRLPSLYQQLLMRQNGGALRYAQLPCFDSAIANFSGIPHADSRYPITQFTDYVECTCALDALFESKAPPKYFDLRRLILFSDLDGHSAACLDYGYLMADALVEPQVCFISDDGDQFGHFAEVGPRFASFSEFVNVLVRSEDDAEVCYVGITSTLCFEALVQALLQCWQVPLTQHHDDRYGWFNFDSWYSGAIPLTLDQADLDAYAATVHASEASMHDWIADSTQPKTRRIHAILSPNRTNANTYRFQEYRDLTLVLEMRKTWFELRPALTRLVNAACQQLPHTHWQLLV